MFSGNHDLSSVGEHQKSAISVFQKFPNVKTYLYNAELVTELNIPHTAVLSGTWKSTLGIKGKNRPEQKRNAQAYVNTMYGIKATQDECDAICIGSHITNKPKTSVPLKPVDEGFDWSD